MTCLGMLQCISIRIFGWNNRSVATAPLWDSIPVKPITKPEHDYESRARHKFYARGNTDICVINEKQSAANVAGKWLQEVFLDVAMVTIVRNASLLHTTTRVVISRAYATQATGLFTLNIPPLKGIARLSSAIQRLEVQRLIWPIIVQNLYHGETSVSWIIVPTASFFSILRKELSRNRRILLLTSCKCCA